MANKTLIRFNVQNVKFAMPKADETYETPVAFGSATKISLEADTSTKKVYGDGKVICTIVNDKGKTGTLGLNNICNDYEIACGRKLQTKNGLAQISQIKNIAHCIYFETCGMESDGNIPIAKTWLYGVTSSRPSESFDQNTDDINESSFEIAMTIQGTNLKSSDGSTVFKDGKGNEILVWQMTVEPSDAGFDTFGDAVLLPIATSTNKSNEVKKVVNK